MGATSAAGEGRRSRNGGRRSWTGLGKGGAVSVVTPGVNRETRVDWEGRGIDRDSASHGD